MELQKFSDSICASILVVDDHPSTASTLARTVALLGSGIRALVANSGEQALQIAASQPVDILITDYMMPGINGVELIEKLQSTSCQPPVYTIIITAIDPDGVQIATQDVSINQILLKPVAPQRICELVSNAINQLSRVTKAGLTPGSATVLNA